EKAEEETADAQAEQRERRHVLGRALARYQRLVGLIFVLAHGGKRRVVLLPRLELSLLAGDLRVADDEHQEQNDERASAGADDALGYRGHLPAPRVVEVLDVDDRLLEDGGYLDGARAIADLDLIGDVRRHHRHEGLLSVRGRNRAGGGRRRRGRSSRGER